MDGDQTGAATATKEPPQQVEEAPPRRASRRSRPKDATSVVAQVRVTYGDPDEFLQELAADAADVQDGIVRVMVRELPWTAGWLQRELQLVAGYVVRGQVCELAWSTPPYWSNPGEPTQEAMDAIAPQLALVTSTCEAGGLEVRGGRFGAL